MITGHNHQRRTANFPRPNATRFFSTLLALILSGLSGPAWGESPRKTISLDGSWQIAEGSLSNAPVSFVRRVPVPGLVSLAEPPFMEVGPKVANRNSPAQKDPRRDAFWYRRTFTIKGPVPAVARLKVGKAMFGTRMFLNGKWLGDHAPCFTPGFFEAKGALKTGENELLIRVGADRDAVGRAQPDGFDFEKSRYIPGIFDSVELVLSGTPNILNAQVAPDLTNRRAEVRVWLQGARDGDALTMEVREVKSKKIAGQAAAHLTAGAEQELDLAVPVSQCRPWSPEDPFLYELTVRTSGDEFKTRFGMREFKFDPVAGRAVLNGRPYYLRGSNFTLYRFFEDGECGNLPWNEKWVRLLHQRVKNMHWNCLRYCIGFPPEAWYRIADEEGILIQDEFPLWFGGPGWSVYPRELKSDELGVEYAEWMRERWNHPSVVIWDASNETSTDQTAPAIQRVRNLDLSRRPWDNSYTAPQQPGDVLELHPYHFQNPQFRLADLATANPVPQGNALHNDGRHAVVINEYGWLWLNRDGAPTTLTKQLYQNLLGTNSTTRQRRHLAAYYTAAETEFWRAHRQAAAVMHFTTLGYSRPDGQTSDHWLPGGVAKLVWEPEFQKYVRDAFAPVGLMIDYWKEKAPAGGSAQVAVILVNDFDKPWCGPVTLRVKRGDRVRVESRQTARIEPLGTTNVGFDIRWPEQTGPCVLETELRGADGAPVHSIRELTIEVPPPPSLALHGLATASSVYQPAFGAANAVDGDEATYWSSAFQDDAWLAVDLGTIKTISRVNLLWETAYAKSFAVQISTDGQTWIDIYKTDDGKGGTSEIQFKPVAARQVRIACSKRATRWGNAIRELELFE